jgi:hypothetical protein
MSDINAFSWQFVRHRPVFSPKPIKTIQAPAVYVDNDGNTYVDASNNIYVDGIVQAQITAVELYRYI